jgi:hypothetical protein
MATKQRYIECFRRPWWWKLGWGSQISWDILMVALMIRVCVCMLKPKGVDERSDPQCNETYVRCNSHNHSC